MASPGEPRSVSIGVAASPEHGDDAEALIDTADRAMYRAKAAGEGIPRRPAGNARRHRRRGDDLGLL